MDSLSPPAIPRRNPTGPLGFLNYLAEIMNLVYEHLFIDHIHVLVFLCSSNPSLRQIDLKRSISESRESPSELRWCDLYDLRYYADGNGKAAQFLRVCKKTWLEGSLVLHDNLRIVVQPSPALDPCLVEHFKSNSASILAWAEIIPIKSNSPFVDQMSPWVLFHLNHLDFDAPRIPPTLIQTVG